MRVLAGVEVYQAECMEFVTAFGNFSCPWAESKYAPTTSLLPADPSIFLLLEHIAVSSSIKCTCECDYEPIKSAPAVRTHGTRTVFALSIVRKTILKDPVLVDTR